MNSDQWDWVHRTLSSAAAWLLHTKAALLSGVRNVCSYQPRKSTNEADRLAVTFGSVLYKSSLTNKWVLKLLVKKESFFYLSVVTHYLDFSSWVNFQCRLSYSVCIAPVCTHTRTHANNTHVHTCKQHTCAHTHTHTHTQTQICYLHPMYVALNKWHCKLARGW